MKISGGDHREPSLRLPKAPKQPNYLRVDGRQPASEGPRLQSKRKSEEEGLESRFFENYHRLSTYGIVVPRDTKVP